MDILAEILAWASMPTIKGNIYWLHGFPGAGKSTIATSMANIFRDLRRLGAFMFFTRGVAARNDPALLIRTLAYQLGEFDHRIGSAIAKVIEEVPSIRQAPLRWQFQKLLVEPFASLNDCLREGPVLVVIDAIDECGQSGAREELLRILASESPRLPPTIRIFITSRAERDIRTTFSTYPHIFMREIDIKSPSNEKDVQTYIHHRMVAIRLQNEWLELSSDWPGKSRTDALALRASGLFIWAYTACRYIEKGQDPEERLSQLVHSALYADAEAALDAIYITALESAGRWDDVAFATDFREIMGLVVVAENPLTAHTIDLLNANMGSRRRPCLHTIRHLGTVLQGAEDKPICVMHPSFEDFITERRRCGSDAWFIDRPTHHLRVARLCIARLGETLKKNICGLKLSALSREEELPEDIAYPARYWVDHLCSSDARSEESVVEDIYSFLRSHFLHWIEVMTVMRKARQTIGLMIQLREWIDTHYADHEALCIFAKDAVRFCQAYAHSALPFTPTATTVFQTFKDDLEIPIVAGGFREHWSPLLIEFGRPGDNVVAISCSPDGQYIASTNTRSIFIWDSTSGELVTKPMQAGKSDFTVIAFSPNNHHIVSGSTDGTVRLWDGLSGKQLGGTLEQHSGPVYGLVFSNDASMVVSASKDQTIVIWDANDGSMIHAPLTGHQKTILALAFSPVGTRFASGARDRSIRIWDAGVGEEALPPIIHRGGGITSLVYTPDGNRIISGSDDRTIHIWDAHEGTLLYNPHAILQPSPFIFKGHNSDIFSIAISPCGTLLASASKDTTVRLWNMSTGTELSHLIRQHRLPVRVVTFSHDGKRIVTGSYDSTVRIWDVESVGSMGTTRLHKGLVSHLAFSADGTWIVSGGLDKTVRVWCAESGQALIDPLRLEREVRAVAFDDDDENGEREGVRIVAVDKDGAVFAWDMATREPLMVTPADHPTAYTREGRLTLEGRWIVDKTTNDALSLLPNMSPARARASWGNKIAIGLANGSIVIMHFPELLKS
ncbi:quinon protein alcohol dehydrogenase-like superfamily [Lanmaoa asiatica]|nr:quinon protein alcohol dehydrogenase-like superfamily [Lanmaoa asiatica]